MTAYVHKALPVEAILFDGTEAGAELVLAWMEDRASAGDFANDAAIQDDVHVIFIDTPEGEICVEPGQWLIYFELLHAFYNCAPDTFEALYEPAAVAV